MKNKFEGLPCDRKELPMKDDDFGFSFISKERIRTDLIKDTDDKVQGMYNLILPLLENLKKNPEKDMIFWPDREVKIDEFIVKLKQYL